MNSSLYKMKPLDYDLKIISTVKRIRKTLKIKELTLARALNISTSYYSKIEKGKKALTCGQLDILGKELGISPSEIFNSSCGL